MLTKDTAHRKDLNAGLAPLEHKHFATIATIIRDMPNDYNGRQDMAEYFAKRLASTNQRFDRRRFLLACGAEF